MLCELYKDRMLLLQASISLVAGNGFIPNAVVVGVFLSIVAGVLLLGLLSGRERPR